MNIAVVGKKKSGKSSLIRRLIYNTFSLIYCPTILNEYQTAIYNDKYKITWWEATNPVRNMDAIIFVTKDADHTPLKQLPTLPTWVVGVECEVDIPFCAPHRVFRVSSLENKGIKDLLISILHYYGSTIESH